MSDAHIYGKMAIKTAFEHKKFRSDKQMYFMNCTICGLLVSSGLNLFIQN